MTEQSVPVTGVEKAVSQMVASAKREADRIPKERRWVLLSLYAEIHRRVNDEIVKMLKNEGQPR